MKIKSDIETASFFFFARTVFANFVQQPIIFSRFFYIKAFFLFFLHTKSDLQHNEIWVSSETCIIFVEDGLFASQLRKLLLLIHLYAHLSRCNIIFKKWHLFSVSLFSTGLNYDPAIYYSRIVKIVISLSYFFSRGKNTPGCVIFSWSENA